MSLLTQDAPSVALPDDVAYRTLRHIAEHHFHIPVIDAPPASETLIDGAQAEAFASNVISGTVLGEFDYATGELRLPANLAEHAPGHTAQVVAHELAHAIDPLLKQIWERRGGFSPAVLAIADVTAEIAANLVVSILIDDANDEFAVLYLGAALAIGLPPRAVELAVRHGRGIADVILNAVREEADR